MAKKIYFYVMTAKHYTLFAVLTLATAAATILLQQYRFCSISADHQFICDSAWLTGHLCNAGGASLIIGSALSQWFVYPWTSGMAAALVYGTIAASTATLLRRRGVSGWLCMAGFVPCAFLFLAMENGSYGFRGHVAFALTSAALALADHLLTGCKRPTSAVGIALLGIALYHLAGSAALLMGACVAMLEIRDRRMPLGGLASLSCCVACGLMAVRRATFVSPTEALTPLQYYNWPSSFFFPLYAWAGLLLAVAAALEMDRRLKTDSRKCAGALTLVAVAVAIAANMFRLVHNPKTYQLRHEAYLAEHGRWDDIIALHRTDRQPVFFISYLNLALAQKGILPQQMDRYNQMDISERLGWQPMSTDGGHRRLLSHWLSGRSATNGVQQKHADPRRNEPAGTPETGRRQRCHGRKRRGAQISPSGTQGAAVRPGRHAAHRRQGSGQEPVSGNRLQAGPAGRRRSRHHQPRGAPIP